MQRVNVQGYGLIDFPDDMSQEDMARVIEDEYIPSFRSENLAIPGDKPPPKPAQISSVSTLTPELDAAQARVDWLSKQIERGATGYERSLRKNQEEVERQKAKIRDLMPEGDPGIDLPSKRQPEMRAGGEPSAFKQAVDKVIGDPFAAGPEGQAKAVMLAEARQQGKTPKQLREEIGPRIGMGARIAKDFTAGAINTGAGMAGYAARLTGKGGMRAAQDLLSRSADELMPSDPAFIDELAAGFGSTAAFFVPGMGIARGAQAVYQVAPRMANWLGAFGAAGMEAAVEAGGVYQELIDKGMHPEVAAAAADKAFWLNAPLVLVTNKLGLFGDIGNKWMQRTLSAVVEGPLQEGPQQMISNYVTGRPLMEGYGRASAIGSIVGAGLGGNAVQPQEGDANIDRLLIKEEERQAEEFSQQEAMRKRPFSYPEFRQKVRGAPVESEPLYTTKGAPPEDRGEPEPEPSPAEPETPRAFRKSKNMVAKNKVDLAKRLESGEPVMIRQENGLHHLITPSAKGDKYQITVYNDTGIISDSQHNSIDSLSMSLPGTEYQFVPANEIDGLLNTFAKAEQAYQQRREKVDDTGKPQEEKKAAPEKAEPVAYLPNDAPQKLYRGYGRADKGTAYNKVTFDGSQASPAPVLGEGQYYSFTPEQAQEFGPEVEERAMDFKNPLVIRSDDQWRALTKELGWNAPNPTGRNAARHGKETGALTTYLRDNSHDAVIIYYDDAAIADQDKYGNRKKTLDRVFGGAQVFVPAAQETKKAAPKKSERVKKKGEAEPEGDEGGLLSSDQFSQIIQDHEELFTQQEKTNADKTAGEFISQEEADARLKAWQAHAQAQGDPKHPAFRENQDKIILSLFDESGVWSAPWAEAGYQVWQVDIQNGVDVRDFDVQYFMDQWGDFEGAEVYGVLAACPCTDFAASGARWWAEKDAAGKTKQSIELVDQTMRTIEYFRPTFWALENPVGRISRMTGIPTPTLSFNPHHYGDPYTKRTMLHGKFNPDLPTANVEPTEGSKAHRLRGDNLKEKKERSLTPEGFAYSFFMANNAWDNVNEVERIEKKIAEAQRSGDDVYEAELREELEEAKARRKQEQPEGGSGDLTRDLTRTKKAGKKGQGKASPKKSPTDNAEKTEKKTPPPENSPSELAAMRKQVLADIDMAIANAPTVKELGVRDAALSHIDVDSVSEAGSIKYSKFSQQDLEKIGYVEIRVPSGGTFKVLNLRERLVEFRKQVEKSPGFKPPAKPRKPSATQASTVRTTIKTMVADGEVMNAIHLDDITKSNLLAFGKGADGVVTLYTDVSDVTFGEYAAIVGKAAGYAEGGKVHPPKPTGWAVVERTTGLTFGQGYGSKAKAIAATKEELKKVGAEKTAKIIEGMEKVSQDTLRERLVSQYTKDKLEKTAKGSGTPGMVAMAVEVDNVVNAWSPGDNYVPLVEQRYSPIPGPAPERSKKPIRREDVLIPLLKALKIPLYQGNVKGKRLGYYMPLRGDVHIKRMNDLEVAAHEIAHALDDRLFNGFGRRKGGKGTDTRPWLHGPNHMEYAKELKGVSYDTTKVYEGWAEYIRLWMTQPEEAKAKAPQFTAWWENHVKTVQYSKAILKARDDFNAWFEQSAIDRAASKVGAGKALSSALDNFWDQSRQAIWDDLHGIYKMETDLSGKSAPGALGPYETARLTRAAYSMVDGAIRLGAPVIQADNSIKYEGKGLRDILNQVGHDLDNWTLYAIGRSAAELKQQGRENLFTTAEIADMLKLRTPLFDQVFDEYQEWNGKIVDFAVKKGLISAKDRKTWTRKQYLPFYRVGMKSKNRQRKGVPGNVKVVHRLTGGTGNLDNILDNMVNNASRLITESLKNEARVRAIDFALTSYKAFDESGGYGGSYVAPLATRAQPVSIDKQQMVSAVLKALGISRAALDSGMLDIETQVMIDEMIERMDDYHKFWTFGHAPVKQGETDVVAVMRGGKAFYYNVGDPMLMRALASLDRKPKATWIKPLATLKRIGQGTVTLTFDFMAANIWRDTLHAGVLSQNRFKPGVSSISGFKHIFFRDQVYRDWIANGGGLSSYLVDESAMEEHIKSFYHRHGFTPSGALHLGKQFIYALEQLADAFESATRVGEFEAALKRGVHPRHAAYLSREVSTDFAMRGDSETLGKLLDTVMFLKAAMNGMDRVYRAGTKDVNRQQVWLYTGMIAGLSAALAYLNYGNPFWDDMEDWEKYGNWHFFVRKGDGDGSKREDWAWSKFPKIWEVGAIASMAEATTIAWLDALTAEGLDAKAYGQSMWNILTDQFKLDWAPYVAAPVYEQAINKSRFLDRDIVTRSMEDLPPYLQYTPGVTSPAMIELGQLTKDWPKWARISPARAEHLWRGYMNTWGYYGIFLADMVVAGDNAPAKGVPDYPVARRFVGKDVPTPKQNSGYWQFVRDSKEIAAEMAKLRNMANQKWAEQRLEQLEQSPKGQIADIVSDFQTGIAEINAAIVQAYESNTLSPEEKKTKIDSLKLQRNKLQGQGHDAAYKIQREQDPWRHLFSTN